MPYDKPGCFGYASTYNVKSDTCSACNEREACSAQARAGLEQLAQIINVDAALKLMHNYRKEQAEAKKPVRNELTDVQQKLVSRMSKHAARLAEFLLLKKVNYRQLLLQGTNPLKGEAPVSIALLFDLMLKGPVSRADYLMALKNDLGQTPATAASQASIGFQVITGIGIGRYSDDCLVIRSNP